MFGEHLKPPMIELHDKVHFCSPLKFKDMIRNQTIFLQLFPLFHDLLFISLTTAFAETFFFLFLVLLLFSLTKDQPAALVAQHVEQMWLIFVFVDIICHNLCSDNEHFATQFGCTTVLPKAQLALCHFYPLGYGKRMFLPVQFWHAIKGAAFSPMRYATE